MLVSEILRIKGHTLFTAPPHTPVLDAIKVMVQHDIGSLVVMDRGKLAGLLTFREVLEAVARGDGSVGTTPIAELCDPAPPTAAPGLDVMELRRIMLERHARYVPVMDGTTLAGGSLIVNGTLPAGTFTISTGTTLGGRGVIYPAVTIPTGATLAPGASIGTLTVSNNLTLQAGSTTRLEISKTPFTNDFLRVTGTFNRSGTLVVTNVSGDLAPGDTFSLYQAGTLGGAFTTTTLPPLNPGLAWNTSGLSTGVVSVVATALPAFTSMVPSAGAFTLGGTGAASQSYTLEAATNLTTPIFWLPVTNTIADTNGGFELLDLEATNYPQRFYRVTAP